MDKINTVSNNQNSILIEQKRAELKVKLTILQENINNLKHELSASESNSYKIYPGQVASLANLEQISHEYNCANELFKLKKNERDSLEADLTNQKKQLESMKSICCNLIEQKNSLEKDNLYYKQKTQEILEKVNEQKKLLFEMDNKENLLKQEIEILRGQQISNNKLHFDNEQKEKHTTEQQNYITEQIKTNNKRIEILQIKVENLNKDIFAIKERINSIINENKEANEYNIDIEKKIIELSESSKMYNDRIILLKKEIDDTKEYINNSNNENKNLENKLEMLVNILQNINQANTRINANLNLIRKSLEKKAEFMKNEENYYANCEKAKQKMVDLCKEINSYSDLI